MFLTISPLSAATRYFVTVAGGGTGTGNWSNACTLQQALGAAVATDEIWVAQGVYHPTEPFCIQCPSATGYHATFLIPDGVRVYGGFRGPGFNDPNDPGESSLNQRDEFQYLSVLSGDIDDDDTEEFDNRDDNVYHVVTALDVGPTTKLSGFTIRGGEAADPNLNDVYERFGGGVLIVGTNGMSSLHITRCIIRENRAWEKGGGVSVQWDNIPNDPNDVDPVRIVNTTIARNVALDPNEPTADGGGAAFHPASFEITNCIFDQN